MDVPNADSRPVNPGKITEETKQKAREMESLGVPRTVIAKRIGVHRITLNRWFGPKREEGAA